MFARNGVKEAHDTNSEITTCGHEGNSHEDVEAAG